MQDDIAEYVTGRLLDLMERHGANWIRPWIGSGLHRNVITKVPYRGVNQPILGTAGYEDPHWGTYKQLAGIGAQVRKGEKATHIVFWKPLNIKDKETGEDKLIWMARDYSVFNVQQCDNAPKIEIVKRSEIERHAECERIIAATGAEIRYGGDRAFYSPTLDQIQLPKSEQFNSREGFYGTGFHEIGHWTGHASRLNRPLIARFGTEAYAFEELIAETTSALCCAATGITPEPRPDHAQYLNNWLKVLRGDKKAIFTAFSKAQAAADFIMDGKAPTPEPEPTRPEGKEPTIAAPERRI